MRTPWFLIAMTVTGSLGAPALRATAAVEISGIVRAGEGVTLRWAAEIRYRYEVQSAGAVTGPWRTRMTLGPVSGQTEWKEDSIQTTSHQFYRLLASDAPAEAAPANALFLGDWLPRQASLIGEQGGTIAANAVFLASQLGAGGLQLVLTGALMQQGPNWTYTPTPTDRLNVQFATGTNVTFYVTRMQGDFSVDAITFLRRNHNFDYRVVIPGQSDLAVTSDVGTGSPTFRATVRGSQVVSNTTYNVDLALNGEYRFETDTSGSSLLNDYLVTGSVTGGDYALTVQQRRRFELVVAQVNFGGATRFEDATSDQEWINHSLRMGGDTFQWVDAAKQKSFKNGQPSSVDTYWQASGGIVKNGAPYGDYQFRTDPLLGLHRFYLVLPNEEIELESWRNNP